MEGFYYTYILQSIKDGNNYAGYTKDLNLRFEQHQNGEVDSTKHRRPLGCFKEREVFTPWNKIADFNANLSCEISKKYLTGALFHRVKNPLWKDVFKKPIK